MVVEDDGHAGPYYEVDGDEEGHDEEGVGGDAGEERGFGGEFELHFGSEAVVDVSRTTCVP